MINEEFFHRLKDKIKDNYEEGGSHAFDHTERVYNLALKIGKKEKADIEILKIAALLHDIARLKEDKNEVECHAEHGSIMAEKILKEMNFPDDKIEKVVHAIRVHRHSKGLKAETKEAEIIQDADRLDALGAITIARIFSTGGKINRPIHNPNMPFTDTNKGYNTHSTIHAIHEKIFKIKPETFNTPYAKKLAKGRYKFVEKFVKEFFKEWKGEL
jgi:uncharacterized protein